MIKSILTPIDKIKERAFDHDDQQNTEMSDLFQEAFTLGYLIAQAEIDEKYQRIQEQDRELQSSKRCSCQ